MPLTLKESFQNVKIVCDSVREPGLNNVERAAVNEALGNIAGALQAHELMLQASKEEKEKPQLEDKSDEDVD